MISNDMGFRNVYVIHKVDYRHQWIVGIFEAEGLAEMAREKLEAELSEDLYDCGVRFSITAYQLGKVYE